MSVTVGIFANQSDAEGAIDRLAELGLDEGDIHVMTRRGIDRGGESLFGTLARGFRGEGDVAGELMRLGLDREEAEFYEEELEGEGALVAVQAHEEDEDAVLAIMREAEATFRED